MDTLSHGRSIHAQPLRSSSGGDLREAKGGILPDIDVDFGCRRVRRRRVRAPGIPEETAMPHHKDLKRLVRSRMQKTGESYTAARAQLTRKQTRSKNTT